MTYTQLSSSLDHSVNFVRKTDDGGNFEARFVWRGGRYITAYLSSHSGCVKACRFCHLTGDGQTFFSHATLEDYVSQAEIVLAHLNTLPEESRSLIDQVYFSFMARGEPLANRTILKNGDEVLWSLAQVAKKYNLASRFCVSTIFPREMRDFDLSDIFPAMRPVIYYSLYSLNPDVRKKWVPQALSPDLALDKLAEWNSLTLTNYKIHGAIIKDVNDDFATWDDICKRLDDMGQKPTFNLVPYNPHGPGVGEPGNIDLVKNIIEDAGFEINVKNRVGFDVKASCGMFVPASKPK